MKTDPFNCFVLHADTDALDIMENNRVGCLPVVDNGRLVGIVTSYDFLAGAARLFREHLSPWRHQPLSNKQKPSTHRLSENST